MLTFLPNVTQPVPVPLMVFLCGLFFFFSPLTAAGCIAPIQPCLNCAAVTVEMKHKERHAEALFVNLLFKTNLFVFKLCWNLLKAVN